MLADPLARNEALSALERYALLARADGALSLHRLVQAGHLMDRAAMKRGPQTPPMGEETGALARAVGDRWNWNDCMAKRRALLRKLYEKLELLNPKLAVPYRQRQGKQATLEQLRYQVYMLQRDNPDDQCHRLSPV